jgi:hypothetical protein
MMNQARDRRLQVEGYLLAAVGLLLVPGQAVVVAAAEVNREAIVSALRNQERAIQSAEIDYSVKVLPTRSDQMSRFREALERPYRPGRYSIVSEDSAAAESYQGRWWRHGLKERFDRVPLSRATKTIPFVAVTAFDGEWIRLIGSPQVGKPLNCWVDPPDNVHWFDTDRETPFSLTFRFYDQPISELVETAKDLTIDRVHDSAGELIRVTFTCDKRPDRLRLYLDRDFHPVKREVDTLWPDAKPSSQTTVLEAGQFTAADGKRIWFPRKAVLRYLLGEAKDGTPVPWLEKLFTFHEAKFNMAIGEETFAPQFPKGALIHEPLRMPKSGVIYNSQADAKAEIDAALRTAKRDNKRVLIEFGRNGTFDCARFHELLTKGYLLPPILKKGFVLVLVDVEENPELFDRHVKDDEKVEFPFLAVLDSDGKVVKNVNGPALRNYESAANLQDILEKCSSSK